MSEGEHVYFPGGYRSPVLNALDKLYREGPIIFEPWSVDDVRLIVGALSPIDEPNHQLLLRTPDLQRARRARRLAALAIDSGKLSRAERLIAVLLAVLEDARAVADDEDAREARRSRPGRSKGGKSSGESRRKSSVVPDRQIQEIALSLRRQGVADHNLTSETRAILQQRKGAVPHWATIRNRLVQMKIIPRKS